MGMFDYLRCRFPLPVEGANDLQYQTKDLDCMMNQCEIREDGSLWQEDYDIEDHSDPSAKGVMRLAGMLTRVNKRWERVMLTGEVCFYSALSDQGAMPRCGWIEWSAYFKDGALQQLNLLTHELPQAAPAVDPVPVGELAERDPSTRD